MKFVKDKVLAYYTPIFTLSST